MKRSKFSLSNYKLLSADMGNIIPCGLTEVLPGDTIQQATSALVRLSPMVAPVMHPVHIRIHHWFVPHRLVWDDWEKFITGGPDGNDASVFPTKSGAVVAGTPEDYYGVPPGVSIARSVLPLRGYQLIYNEWYRDQDLSPERTVSRASGVDSTTVSSVGKAHWEKDYFTTARPWVTKGPAVDLPLGTTAPVVTTSTNIRFKQGSGGADFVVNPETTSSQPRFLRAQSGAVDGTSLMFGSITGLQADLTNASAVGINELREAFALQRYQEARARYGSRYTEYLAYLGVQSSDARLQRPEYLGGGKQTVQISEVLQTAPVTSNGVVGTMKGHGIGALRSNRYRRFFSEHGYIHSFIIVMPKTMYSQSLSRTFNRRTKEDFWQKELQHIGQQEVLNKEVYAAHTTPDGVFGYQDRYDEYRRAESTIAGEFRSTLNYWHMAREFAADPALNSTFVQSDPTTRIFADQTNDPLWVMVNHSIQARRMVARQGTSSVY